MLGTVGESERIDTTLADAVNVPSRVEGLTKQHDARFIVTKAVVELLDDPAAVSLVSLGEVHVKGVHRAIEVYALSRL